MELLDSAGKLLRIGWKHIKWVCYVREFNREAGIGLAIRRDAEGPERLLRRRFAARPRAAGLWLRLTFLDGEELEGVAANDRTLIDGTGPGAGLLLTPPDTRSNTQRVFVPRCAIQDFAILGVIQPRAVIPERDATQPGLFEPDSKLDHESSATDG